MPDLEKMRRFSLLAAIVLFVYSAAGIQPEQAGKISLLGFPFTISSTELIPIGLVALSVYALVRFYYYGMMLYSTPFKIRRDLIKKLHAEDGYGTYKGSVYFGPNRFSTTPLVHERTDVEPQVEKIIAAFPKLGRRRPEGKIVSHQVTDEDGEPYTVWEAQLSIPVTCRLAAFFQDVDYTAPIWANVGALTITMAKAVNWQSLLSLV